MYRLSKDSVLSPELIVKYIEKNRNEVARLNKLYEYYIGKHAIKQRTMADPTKPNNKVVNPYATYITDLGTGYFMGEPVSYSSEEEQFLEEIKSIYNYNDESAENAELAKDGSIFGKSYELLYLDDDKAIRFKKISPIGCIPIYDNTIEEDLLYFIRYYDDENIMTGEVTTFVEVYSRTYRQLYKKSFTTLELIEEEQHAFNAVPVVIYQNNAEELGDFEEVIPLIDAYDKIQSDSVNDMEYFADAYLAMYGIDAEPEDISAMKEQRVLLFPSDAKAEWLVKSINDTYVENLKTRLDKDIHKFSTVPAMTDEQFASNASGVAMKYKLMGLENITAKKERCFKKGLQRRLEIICNMLAVMGMNYDYRAIDIIFKRNIPANLTEMAEVIDKIGHLFSEETQISLLPIDVDYTAEKVKKDKEKEAGYSFPLQDEGEVNGLLAEKNIS